MPDEIQPNRSGCRSDHVCVVPVHSDWRAAQVPAYRHRQRVPRAPRPCRPPTERCG
jgi:hypothetical protein